MSNPWKDIASYSFNEAKYFKGREEDIAKFTQILNNGNSAVIYSESGIGKTSLINAGIEPIMVERGFYPIHIRFDELFKEDVLDLEHWLIEKVRGYCMKDISGNIPEYLPTYSWDIEKQENTDEQIKRFETESEKHFWWFLHGYQMFVDGEQKNPLLIFDQFEEIFVNGKKYNKQTIVEDFFRIMEEVSSASMPYQMQSFLGGLYGKNTYLNFDNTHKFKIIFSLRKEFLSEFDYWTNDQFSIPELHQNRMFLLPLTCVQAERVITEQPTMDNSDDGDTVKTLTKISDEIIEMIDNKRRNEVEPFILSILCSRLYNEAISKNKSQLDVDDLKDIKIEKLLLKFYEETINEIFKEDEHVQIVENVLVDYDGHRNRVKVNSKELNAIGFEDKYFDSLKDRHLIRPYDINDDEYVELIHDRIAEVIHIRQDERNANKKKKKEHGVLWFLRVLWIIILCVISVSSIYYGFRHYEYSPYSELSAGTQYGKSDNRTVNVEDNLVERLIVRGQDSIKLTFCYMLRSVEFEDYKKDSLYLSIIECPLLENVHIPSQVKYLNIAIADNCPKLKLEIGENIKSVIVGDPQSTIEFYTQKNRQYIWRDKILWDKKNEKPIYTQLQKGVHEVVIPYKTKNGKDSLYNRIFIQKGITKKKQYASSDTFYVTPQISTYRDSIPRSIQNILFSDNVDTLGGFDGCSKIQDLSIPANVKRIEDGCFANCTGLRFLTIEGNASIGKEAFANCKSLVSVNFNGDSITLGDNVFANCTNLSSINLPKNIDFQTYQLPMRLNEGVNYVNYLPYACNPFFGCFKLKNINLYRNENLLLIDGILYNEKNVPVLANTEDYYFEREGYSVNDYGIFLSSKRSAIPIWVNNPRTRKLFSSFYTTITDSLFCDSHARTLALLRPLKEIVIPPVRNTIHILPGNLEWLETIKMPFPQPKKMTIDLPDSLKEKITLVIPDGCTRYYECIPAFSTFKAIKEEGQGMDLYDNFIADTFFSNYSVSTFISYYYVWLTLFFFFFGIIYFYLRQSNRTRFSAFVSSLGYVTMMIITYVPIYWLIFFLGYNTVWSNLVAILISLFFCSLLIFGKNVVSFVMAIVNAVIWITKVFIPKAIKKVFKYRNILLILVITILIVILGLYVYRDYHDLDKAVLKKDWKRAVNLMCDKIKSQDSLVVQDSIMLRNILIHSIEIPNLTEDDYTVKINNTNGNNICAYDKGAVVILKDNNEESRVYDFLHRKFQKYDVLSEHPLARLCKNGYLNDIDVRNNNLAFDVSDTIFVFPNCDITKTPQIIRGRMNTIFDSLVCVHNNKDSTFILYNCKTWNPRVTIKVHRYFYDELYNKLTNTLAISSKKHLEDSVSTVQIIMGSIFEQQSFELSGSVRKILHERYIVTEKDSTICFYDMEKRQYLSERLHGSVSYGYDNLDAIVLFNRKGNVLTLYTIRDNGLEKFSLPNEYCMGHNFVGYHKDDTLFALNVEDMRLYNLGVDNNYYPSKINDSLIYRHVDSLHMNYIYKKCDSISLFRVITSGDGWNDVSVDPPHVAFNCDSIVSIYDLSDSLKKVKEFCTKKFERLSHNYCICRSYYADNDRYFPIDGIPDEMVKVEGNIQTPIYDGWCFTQVGIYYRLINMDPLRSLIRKSEFLSEKKKQNLYRLIDKNKGKSSGR